MKNKNKTMFDFWKVLNEEKKYKENYFLMCDFKSNIIKINKKNYIFFTLFNLYMNKLNK